MATTKKPADEEIVATELDPKELVELKIPRSSNPNDPGVFISVNGHSFLLPHGKVSKVPRYIAEEYERGQRAEEEYFEKIDRMVAESK